MYLSVSTMITVATGKELVVVVVVVVVVVGEGNGVM